MWVEVHLEVGDGVVVSSNNPEHKDLNGKHGCGLGNFDIALWVGVLVVIGLGHGCLLALNFYADFIMFDVGTLDGSVPNLAS